MEPTFAEAFRACCKDVIEPTLARLAEASAFCTLPRSVVLGPGQCAATDTGKFADNRRIMLKTRTHVELWFVAWEPHVLMQVRRATTGSEPEVLRLEQITPAFVERLARVFLDSLHEGKE